MGRACNAWVEQREARGTDRLLTLDSTPAERYERMTRQPFLADVTRLRSQQEEVMKGRAVAPLFDDDLLRLISRFPPLALMASGYLRGLMRQAVSDLLPAEVAWRPGKAFMDPAFAEMVRIAGGFEKLADLTNVQRLADLRLIEPRPFRAQIDRLARNPLDMSWAIVWSALSIEEFLRQYDEGWGS
jgi:hypothetical protein